MNVIRKKFSIELKALLLRYKSLRYNVKINNEAKDMVSKKGYDVQFGARPLKRAIQNYIEDGLCELIINGDLKMGSRIVISKKTDKEELDFNIEE